METDYEAFKFWLDLAWKIGTVIGLTWLALSQKPRKNARRLDELTVTVAEHAKLFVKIEGQLQHSPTHEDLDRLHDRISKGNDSLAETRVDVAKLLATSEATGAAINRIQSHLLEKDK